ncbi:hypothetical protein Spico_0074 [Parasphaerochaeta coccoides DSM 17374]|uniref:Uncharacterized protein n=1 Tax=Parasphaerochaeta coccoides (strain ATCC BAA-1237 / DSM 17374 / SPN1) TaxID=760011 RepID=F4GJ21_PARC1|nr:hypothetical protein Spico_0074 [Parasphaerochaeta coccoides DSM 17374]
MENRMWKGKKLQESHIYFDNTLISPFGVTEKCIMKP